jgi:putative heme transporter
VDEAIGDSAPNLRGATPRSGVDGRTIVALTAAVLGGFAFFAIFRIARGPLTQLMVGVILALALDPLVVATHRRFKVGRGLAVAIVGFGLLIVASTSVALLGPPARNQASRFTRDLPETIRKLEDLPGLGQLITKYDVETKARKWVDELPAKVNDQTIEKTANRLLSNVASMLVVGCTTIAVLLDGERIVARFRRLFRHHPAQLDRVDRVGRVLYTTLGQYFGGSLTVAVMMGLFVLIVALVLGIPLAPLAAIWAMFTDLIPQVGGFLGGSFLVILALAKGPVVAIIALVLFVVYMNIENHIIQPAIIGQSVNLSPPTTMLAAFIGGAIAGIPGALIATPTVGAAKRLYLEYRFGEVNIAQRPGFIQRMQALLHRRRHRDDPDRNTMHP